MTGSCCRSRGSEASALKRVCGASGGDAAEGLVLFEGFDILED